MLWRQRARHVHIPNYAPHYTPYSLVSELQKLLHHQIEQTNRTGKALDEYRKSTSGGVRPSAGSEPEWINILKPGNTLENGKVLEFLKKASPPPTILSFSLNPHYSVTDSKYQKGTSEYNNSMYSLQQKYSQPLRLSFPRPPAAAHNSDKDGTEAPAQPQDHWRANGEDDPLDHTYTPTVIPLPGFRGNSPRYRGPGQLHLWPVLDLKDTVQLGSYKYSSFWNYEKLLQQTTIEVLQREFGITAFTERGREGLWVESYLDLKADEERKPCVVDDRSIQIDRSRKTERRHARLRRIATFHAIAGRSDVTSYGINLHVSQPQVLDAFPTRIAREGTGDDPAMRQTQNDAKRMTSIAAEVAARESRRQAEASKPVYRPNVSIFPEVPGAESPIKPVAPEKDPTADYTGTVWNLVNSWATRLCTEDNRKALQSDLDFARRGEVNKPSTENDDEIGQPQVDSEARVLSTPKIITDTLLTGNNHPLAVAWSHEFARQIGMNNDNAVMEHLGFDFIINPWIERPISPRAWTEEGVDAPAQNAEITGAVSIPARSKITPMPLPEAKQRYRRLKAPNLFTVVGGKPKSKAEEEEENTGVLVWPGLQYALSKVITLSSNGRHADTRGPLESRFRLRAHRENGSKLAGDQEGKPAMRRLKLDNSPTKKKHPAVLGSFIASIVDDMAAPSPKEAAVSHGTHRKTGKELREELERKWRAENKGKVYGAGNVQQSTAEETTGELKANEVKDDKKTRDIETTDDIQSKPEVETSQVEMQEDTETTEALPKDELESEANVETHGAEGPQVVYEGEIEKPSEDVAAGEVGKPSGDVPPTGEGGNL